MNNSKISARNLSFIVCLLSVNSILMTGFGNLGSNMWFAVICGLISSIPLIAIYIRISALFPGKGLFEIISNLFGSIFGKILIVLIVWYAIHISSLSNKNFSEFVVSISLQYTPKVFIMIGMCFVSAYLAYSGIEIIGKWSIIIMGIIAINMFLTTLFSLNLLDFSHLEPIFERNILEYFKTGMGISSIAFNESFLILPIAGSIIYSKNATKSYVGGILIGGVFIILTILRNCLVLGPYTVSSVVFPSYITARVASPGNFVEHIESIVSFNLLLMGISKLALCIKVASIGLAYVFNMKNDSKDMIIPVTLISLGVCVTNFSNIEQLIEFVNVYKTYALIFTLIIPLIIWIKAEFSKNKTDLKAESNNMSV